MNQHGKNGRCDFFQDFNGLPPLDEEPTAAVPGSAEKQEVLRRRAEQQVCLWHPQDGRGGGQVQVQVQAQLRVLSFLENPQDEEDADKPAPSRWLYPRGHRGAYRVS
jgi:hypothetical protein